MNWNLTGSTVKGIYCESFPYTGVVQSSRVKYGGKVQHTILVDVPFMMYGGLRSTVLADENEVTVVEQVVV